jgi:hypothetical protein
LETTKKLKIKYQGGLEAKSRRADLRGGFYEVKDIP